MNKIIKSVIIFFLLSTITLQTACRKDDICTLGGTPNLGIGFFDSTAPDDIKTVTDFYLIALPDNDTVYKAVSADSIKVPLNVNDNQCRFIFTKDTNNDTLLFSYGREPVFVSKACGYKTVFHQLQIDLIQDNNLWIKQIEILQTDITIDTINVKIYH